jgi:FHS family Na+ dependent glucose MFS transporter 1
VCTCLLPYSSSLLGMYSIAFVWGIGTGSLDTGGNVQMLDIWTGRDSGPYMHALSFVWSVGAVLAPLVAMPFLKNVPEELLHPSSINNTSTSFVPPSWNETTKSNGTAQDIRDDIWSVKTLFPLVGLVTGLVACLFIYYFLRDAMKRRGQADIAQISESVAKESLAESPPANRALIEATVVALLALLFFLYVGLEAGLAIKNPPKKTHPKKPQKTHLKKPTKNVFLGF